MKFPEENIGKKLLDIDLGKDFLWIWLLKHKQQKHKKHISYKKLLFKIYKELK